MNSFKDHYPMVDKIITEAAVPPPKDGIVFAKLKKYKTIGGRQVYMAGRGKRLHYYIWDALHGHWEVYSKHGVNIESLSNAGILLKQFKKSDNRKRLKL